jgi:hypothetical protein
MTVSVDFGSREIRSLVRAGVSGGRLRLMTVRSEYVLIPDESSARRMLREEGLPHAICGAGLAVFGAGVERLGWLSRRPAVPLFTDGRIPTRDGLARQILGVLTESVLPEPMVRGETCVLTVPGAGLPQELRESNEDFLGHLVQMRGYCPVVLGAAEAVQLAGGRETGFSGVSVSAGAESLSFCVSRQGRVLASGGIPLGGRWLDSELAREFEDWVWDESGERHPNAAGQERWRLSLVRSVASDTAATVERLGALQRLLLRMTRRLAAGIVESVRVAGVEWERVPVLLAGGFGLMRGLSEGLSADLEALSADGRQYEVRTAADAETAVVRGGLIYGELESRSAA